MSIPHGGDEVPPEVAERVVASRRDVFEDGDAATREIYGVAPAVEHLAQASIARAFVDLNRAPDDRPPANPDGVVKTETCYGRRIYRDGEELDDALVETLLSRYYNPYHDSLASLAAEGRARFGLDCHSMAEVAPKIAPDVGGSRPLFCLSNARGASCDDGDLQRLGAAIVEAFECRPEEVAFNEPFTGGFITRRHGRNPLPWAQIEMNRSLYLAEEWSDSERLSVTPERLKELNGRFTRALEIFVG